MNSIDPVFFFLRNRAIYWGAFPWLRWLYTIEKAREEAAELIDSALSKPTLQERKQWLLNFQVPGSIALSLAHYRV